MACPKHKTSKAKTKSRKANWYQKTVLKIEKALSLSKSIASGKSTSFQKLNIDKKYPSSKIMYSPR
uniref:ribosomal protein L32 n=1 Tax=Haramonas pauciplastida TaxID=478668 RepID=UPI0021150665|nr:ribosomal protein L32 [Haramonas pauciplastida]YP_010444164.1 ribosomal protein L32 [Haramonas pauciplastida]UTE95048.1 ribosomal protein L32 [Haramonas pauciplastida]UTE95050.1 ribosomal protein L32 [Haramonas pauciplastida]